MQTDIGPNMMTEDQKSTVSQGFAQFSAEELKATAWTDVDECMSLLDWLEDVQLVIEAEALFNLHKKGTPRCGVDHPIEHCFVPMIIDAVSAIIVLHKETQYLHQNNRYILQMYLSLTRIGEIVV